MALAGCGGNDAATDTLGEPPPTAPESIKLQSPAFGKNDTIPKEFTCDGENSPPPLQWSNVPKESKELALLVEDPDAPSGNFVHWGVYGIDPRASSVEDATEGENSAGKKGYTGPCPPEGDDPHRYVFALYALDEATGLAAGASPDDVRSALDRSAIARGQLIAKYGR